MSEVTAPPAGQTTSHFADLDGVRGVLAFTIMLYHYGLDRIIEGLTFGVIPHAPWTSVVDFFLILSGFVLARAYSRRPRRGLQVLVERFFRLIPVHWVILLACAPVYFYSDPHSPEMIVADFAAVILYFGETSWNGPSWTINLEFYLPVFIPFALRYVPRLSLRHLLGVLAILLLVDAWLSYQLAQYVEYRVARGVFGFATGLVLYHIHLLRPFDRDLHSLALPAMTGLYMLVIVLAGWQAAFGPVLPLIAVLIVYAGPASRGLLSWGPFWFLGFVSYTLYMVHGNVFNLARYWWGPETLSGDVLAKLAMIAVSLVLALGLSLAIERPFMKLGRAFAQRSRLLA